MYNEHKSGTHETSMIVCAMCRYSKMLCDIATLNGKRLKKIKMVENRLHSNIYYWFSVEKWKKRPKKERKNKKEQTTFPTMEYVCNSWLSIFFPRDYLGSFGLSGNLTINNWRRNVVNYSFFHAFCQGTWCFIFLFNSIHPFSFKSFFICSHSPDKNS